MGTQGAGRKRTTNKERSTAEDDALNLIAREAEARLAAKRAARAEAREIRMKELERQQKELSDEDERMSVGSRGSVRVDDREYLEKGSRAASALTAGTLTSLGGTSSRRGSGETAITVDAETSIREIKDALAEVEEKYRKAMVSNAQLDNEKNNLMYLVDTLKDSLMELEELLSESRREYEDKVKEHEREKQGHKVLQFQFNEMKETLKQSEELLNKQGIVLDPDLKLNGDMADTPHDGLSSGDSASEKISQTAPAEGNSMLGNTEELRSGEEQEEQEQGLFQGRQDDHESRDDENRELLVEDRQLSGVDIVTGGDDEDTNIQDLQEHKSNDAVQEIKNSLDETCPETEEVISEPLGEINKPESDKLEQERPAGDVCDFSEAAKTFVHPKEGDPRPEFEEEPQKSVVVTKTDQDQEPDNNNEAENEAAEEVLRKSQSQPSSGKRKKKKRKGKKKNASQEEKKEESNRSENTKTLEVEVEGSTVEDVGKQQRSTFENEPSNNKQDVTEPTEPIHNLVDNQIQDLQTDLTVDITAVDSQINQVCHEQTGEDTKDGNDDESTEDSFVDQESPEQGEQEVKGGDGVKPTEVMSEPTSPEDRDTEVSTEISHVNEASDQLMRQDTETELEPLDKCLVNLDETELEREDLEDTEPVLRLEDSVIEAKETMTCHQAVDMDEEQTEANAQELNENVSYCDVLKKGLMDLDSGGPEVHKQESGEESHMGEQSSEMQEEESSVASNVHPESDTEPSLEVDKEPDSDVGLSDTIEDDSGSKSSDDLATEKIGADSVACGIDADKDPEVSNKPTEALVNVLSAPELTDHPESEFLHLAAEGNTTSEVTPILGCDEDSQKGTDVPEEETVNLDLNVEKSVEKPDLDEEESVHEDLSIIKQEDAADTKTSGSQELSNQAEIQCEAVKITTLDVDVRTPESPTSQIITSEHVVEEPAEAENHGCEGKRETGLEEPLEDAARISSRGSEEEDDNEEEGQSFDFDELDFESAGDLNNNPEVEEAEEAVEVLAEGIDDSPSMRSTTTEEWIVDDGGQSEEDSKTLSEETTLENNEEDVADKGSTDANVGDRIPNKVTHSIQLEDKKDTSVLQSHPDQTSTNKDEPQSKKNGKKGKGKGREDCKMS